jgi:hypothetical protein
MATPHFAVADLRTPAELAHFSHPMPLVTAAVKRMLETEHGRDAARLMPAISKVHGKPVLNLADLVYIGGGALIDTYKNIDKVMALLAGSDVTDGTAKVLDHALHAQYAKWRQVLLVTHREAVGVEKEEREEQASDVSIEDKLVWFAGQYHFSPEPDQFSGGAFAKGLVQMGLGYEVDAKTDWRRARPSNGRRGEVPSGDKKKALSEKVSITTGLDVYNCLVRKMMTILLLFGDADIGAAKFVSTSRGVLSGTTRWVTLSDVYALKKACAGLQKLPSAKAEELVDWFEGKLSESVKAPLLRTLASALHEHLDVFEARIDSRTVAAVKRENPAREPAPVLSKKQKKAAKAAAALAADAAAAGGAKPRTPDGKKAVVKKPKDQAQALPRMDGGNPDGAPCRKYAKGTCAGPCRFSHEAEPEASPGDEEGSD